MILRFLRVHLWFFFFQRSYHLSSAFVEDHVYFDVEEEMPIGTVIGTLKLLPDRQYRLSGTTPEVSQLLTLITPSGELRTISRLDREALVSTGLGRTIDLVVVSHPSISVTNVHIRIRDVNDNAPTWPHLLQTISFSETSIRGTKMPLERAVDADEAENGTIVEYRLVNMQNNDSTVPFKLVMDADSGSGSHVFLELTDELDHEKIASYQLELFAFDGGTPKRNSSCHVSVTILDANDNAPVFEDDYTNITIPKGVVDLKQPLFHLTATDADSGSNAAISYRIAHDSTGQFAIEERTGQLFSKVSQLSCVHHAEDGARLCTVTVEALDHGSPALSSHAYVNIFIQDVLSSQPVIDLK